MLRILGEMRVGETRLRFRSRRAAELLGLLAVERPEGVLRAQAAATLWPESEPERAAHNLRQTIVYLREALGEASETADAALHADRARLCLDLPVDAREFLRLANGGGDLWPAALALDEGPLLAGIEGEWADRARTVHEGARLDLLVALSRSRRTEDAAEALRLARRAVEIDPLVESARRAKMEALVALGERPRAVEEFAEYDRLLRAELGLAASPTLRETAFGEEGGGVLAGIEPSRPDEPEPPLTPSAQLTVAVGLAPRYEASERLRTGIAALRRALDEGDVAPPELRSRALAWISRFEFGLGDWLVAARTARAALGIAPGGGGAAFSRVQLARALAWTRDTQEARSLAESALRAAKIQRDHELGAEALLTLGACAWHEDDLRRSVRLYARAGRWALRAASPVQETRAFLSLASSRFRLEGAEAAIEVSTRAIDAAARSGLASLTAHARGDLARYREAAGDLEAASRGYAAALVATEGGRNPVARSHTLTYMGDLETRLGRPESARGFHEEAVALRRVAGDRVGLATSLRGLGKSLLASGQARPAKAALLESIRLFEAGGADDAPVTARIPLARAMRALGETREAASQARLAAREWDALDAVSRAVQVTDGSLDETSMAEFRTEFGLARIGDDRPQNCGVSGLKPKST